MRRKSFEKKTLVTTKLMMIVTVEKTEIESKKCEEIWSYERKRCSRQHKDALPPTEKLKEKKTNPIGKLKKEI